MNNSSLPYPYETSTEANIAEGSYQKAKLYESDEKVDTSYTGIYDRDRWRIRTVVTSQTTGVLELRYTPLDRYYGDARTD